ncbi:Piso0_000531 [Millerozyma farinosa CBS 7064]|uniref:tRNA:m(4)X modification enzyme TRM13 n=1 Tax=Pichia sorbitophila (strain ATCC MYA-4447 / BCRC 22081 / CBS 7064 / NBRC 10061 / NRRL Y-12695) TaxID=559304 RepID=G8YU86_PICSO|nr:Piso0_000531 [Millerozyma farinosa CBS 7064]CCE73487.1 Piso0_000531 [Millerozyma farinosa CBS 7064]
MSIEKDGTSFKKRKVKDENGGDDSTKRMRCEFFIAKKNRNCSMQRKPNQRFCSEHMMAQNSTENERIPCPLDPKHTVWRNMLESHMKKCNARKKEVRDPWYEENFNAKVSPSVEHKTNIVNETEVSNDEKATFGRCLSLLKEYKSTVKPLKLVSSSHNGFNRKLSETSNKKHLIQQSSLIGNMKKKGMLSSDIFYLEFGCGKGELSKFVNICILDDIKEGNMRISGSQYGFGLIDRGVNRNKSDSRIIKECSEHKDCPQPLVRRTRIDIKDLNLDKFIADINASKVAIISKHLCGAATDLTIYCLLKSSLLEQRKDTFAGVLIAMCCRHACDYYQLLPESREYLSRMGIDSPTLFNCLKKVVSWAVSGNRGTAAAPNKAADASLSAALGADLSSEEKEELGLLARRMVDESRFYAINESIKDRGLSAEMFLYIDENTTLENVCLCITPTS